MDGRTREKVLFLHHVRRHPLDLADPLPEPEMYVGR